MSLALLFLLPSSRVQCILDEEKERISWPDAAPLSTGSGFEMSRRGASPLIDFTGDTHWGVTFLSPVRRRSRLSFFLFFLPSPPPRQSLFDFPRSRWMRGLKSIARMMDDLIRGKTRALKRQSTLEY